MSLDYENGTLRVENAGGLRWQLANVEKPRFTFDYEALSVTDGRALRRVGSSVQPLALDEIRQVKAFVEQLAPPPWATLQKQKRGTFRMSVIVRGVYTCRRSNPGG